MNPTIIIAIVAGLVSLISAIIAWRQAERVKKIEVTTQEYLGRLNSQTQIAIETFKADNERAKKALELAVQESEVIEQKIQRTWQIIQNVKDQIILFKGIFNRSDLEQVSNQFKDASREIMEVYGESGSILPRAAAVASHEAKNIIFSAHRLLDSVLSERRGRQDLLKKKEFDDLLVLRDQLTICQGLLVSERAEIRIHQLQKYTDLLAFGQKGSEDNRLLKE